VNIRSGIGYDTHAFCEERPLVVGGVLVSDRGGLEGHSDADVLCHAVLDAVFGAAGLGDIGQHFPDTDERYRDRKSTQLLAEAVAVCRRSGFRICFVDATVVCDSPKLSGYRVRMQDNLAAALDVHSTAVNVKFTTNERMGFVGRGEGMAALAVATLAWADAAA
jgi:2-C-methyl-D-erythritol 2,4-cyclodiphosphate synthase